MAKDVKIVLNTRQIGAFLKSGEVADMLEKEGQKYKRKLKNAENITVTVEDRSTRKVVVVKTDSKNGNNLLHGLPAKGL